MSSVPGIKELRRICQHSKDDEPDWFLENVDRKISIYVTKLILHLPLTGNHVTLLDILVGVAAGVFLATGELYLMLVGALLWNLFIVFDCVDGEVARYRNEQSVRGLYLDVMGHYIVDPVTFLGLAIGLYSITGDVIVLICGFSAAVSRMLIRLAHQSSYITFIIQSLKPSSGIRRFVGSSKKGEAGLSYYLPLFTFGSVYIPIWVLITILVDLFMPQTFFWHSSVTSTLLLFYGLALPFVWIARTIQVFGRVDDEYQRLFKSHEYNQESQQR